VWECLSANLPRLPDLGANCSEWRVSALHVEMCMAQHLLLSALDVYRHERPMSASPTPVNVPRHSNVRAWRPRNLHQTGHPDLTITPADTRKRIKDAKIIR
jgi:hypothetical protein